MKAQVKDKNHFIIEAEASEYVEHIHCTELRIDNYRNFVCSSEPSTVNYSVSGESTAALVNTPIDISYSPYTTDELLVIYFYEEGEYPYVLLCYNEEMLLQNILHKIGGLRSDCSCEEDFSDVHAILLYYGFKMAEALEDYQKAVKFWNRLYNSEFKSILGCSCHGH